MGLLNFLYSIFDQVQSIFLSIFGIKSSIKNVEENNPEKEAIEENIEKLLTKTPSKVENSKIIKKTKDSKHRFNFLSKSSSKPEAALPADEPIQEEITQTMAAPPPSPEIQQNEEKGEENTKNEVMNENV